MTSKEILPVAEICSAKGIILEFLMDWKDVGRRGRESGEGIETSLSWTCGIRQERFCWFGRGISEEEIIY